VLDELHRESLLLLGSQQRVAPCLAHVNGHRIALGERAALGRRGLHRGLGLVVLGRRLADIDRSRGGGREVGVEALLTLLSLLVSVGVFLSIGVRGLVADVDHVGVSPLPLARGGATFALPLGHRLLRGPYYMRPLAGVARRRRGRAAVEKSVGGATEVASYNRWICEAG
jgi:hypothetical protein